MYCCGLFSAAASEEAFRRWGVFDRQLTDLIVERMSDEVDRFTTRDLVDALARRFRSLNHFFALLSLKDLQNGLI